VRYLTDAPTPWLPDAALASGRLLWATGSNRRAAAACRLNANAVIIAGTRVDQSERHVGRLRSGAVIHAHAAAGDDTERLAGGWTIGVSIQLQV
jgi:hypothetical protein